MSIPVIAINSLLRDPAEVIYMQVSTGSTPGHWAHVGSYRVAKYYERYFAHWLNDMVS